MNELRYSLYRLCECPDCGGSGRDGRTEYTTKCPECRGEGRIRQEIAGADSPEAVGVALVTLAREGEWEGCAFGLLDRMPECERCEGSGYTPQDVEAEDGRCPDCKGSGVKPTGTWLLKPWLPSARNVTDAARTLARSKKTPK